MSLHNLDAEVEEDGNPIRGILVAAFISAPLWAGIIGAFGFLGHYVGLLP